MITESKNSHRIANGDVDQLVNNHPHLYTHINSALTFKMLAHCKMTNVQHLGNQPAFQAVSEMYWACLLYRTLNKPNTFMEH